jgi:hypothetical protein
MPITTFAQWSVTPTSNVDLNSIPLSDSMLANQIDGAFQEMMAQLKAGVASLPTDGSTTPTITSQIGSFNSVSCVLIYRKAGNLVTWSANISVASAGTASGYIIVPLPFTAAASSGTSPDRYPVHGSEVVNHIGLNGHITAGTAQARLYEYDGTTPIVGSPSITCGGEYYV